MPYNSVKQIGNCRHDTRLQ